MTDNRARRPRWRLCVCVAVLLAVVALLVPVLPRQPSPGIHARFEQIENGMTEPQVEEVMGGPRGVYDKARQHATTAVGWGSSRGHRSWWYFPDCTVEVSFDEGGKVNGKWIESSPPESLFDRAARWCKWW